MSEIRLGTIGGPETFAGQSTQSLRRLFPYLSEPTYFRSGSEMFEALKSGEVDAVVGAAANLTGTTEMSHMLARDDSLYVVAEAQLPFGCHLLGRRGASLADVRLVYGGPASIAQARSFLEAALPRAATEIYADPFATAAIVGRGDGSTSVLGTRALAQRFNLELLATDVDEGKVNGNWWALSTRSRFDPSPNRLIVTGRWRGDGTLGRLGLALGKAGFLAATVDSHPSANNLFEADHVVRFIGAGALEHVKAAVAGIAEARLAGALRVGA